MGVECPTCSEVFSVGGIGAHHSMAHDEPYYNALIRHEYDCEPVEWLKEQYHGKGLSLAEIGEELDCNSSTVNQMMERLGIPRRKSNREKPPWFGVDSQGYESVRHNMTDGMVEIRIHRLVAIAEYGTSEVVENDVHHKNEIPWDNRADNLELLSHSEHRRQHALGGE